MVAKVKADVVIKDKFWITYDTSSNKNGTLHKNNDSFTQLMNDGSSKTYSQEDVNSLFEFITKSTEQHEFIPVLGFLTDKSEVHNICEKDNLPCYTKTNTSKIFFAAGWYCIEFKRGGWMEGHCPKLSTLQKYNFIGPFKSETDMIVALKRKLKTQ